MLSYGREGGGGGFILASLYANVVQDGRGGERVLAGFIVG